MASKDYEELVPRIKKALPIVRDNYTKRTLLAILVEAADSIDDQATLLTALKEYNTMLQERVDQQADEAYSELQIRYDIDQLKQEKLQTEVATNQRIIIVALIGVLVLAIALMFIYRSNFSLKRRIRDTKEENVQLHRTIEELLGDSALKSTLNVRQNVKSDSDKRK